MRSTFLVFACATILFAQDAGQVLIPLSDQDPKGAACGAYFRVESGKLIYHLQAGDKTDSQPLDYVVKIVLDNKAAAPSLILKSIAGNGALVTVVMSSADRKAASCLPETVFTEKR